MITFYGLVIIIPPTYTKNQFCAYQPTLLQSKNCSHNLQENKTIFYVFSSIHFLLVGQWLLNGCWNVGGMIRRTGVYISLTFISNPPSLIPPPPIYFIKRQTN